MSDNDLNHNLSRFLPDLAEFREKTEAFHSGALSVPQYKAFSGGFGSYAERGGKTHMLRLRLPGGQVTKEKLAVIVSLCDRYRITQLKLTTCQSIQLHHLNADDLCDIMETAWRAGMISRGGGGDFPRNIMATPLSGVCPGEAFDVLPYAKAAGEYLMGFIKAVTFPRKLKVCFSSTPANEPHATFRDLGFTANADHTFDVWAAGGLGNHPRLGVCVAEGIAPERILYYIKAMVSTFVKYGNYENRGRARTRYLQDTLGTDGFIRAYQEILKEVSGQEALTVRIRPETVTKTGDGGVITDRRVFPQKQEGLYSVFYQPIGGMLSPELLKELSSLMQDMEDAQLRLTPEEGLYVINCTSREAARVRNATTDGADTLFETSVACIGAATCQVGIGDSQALLDNCVKAVRKESFADGVLPKIHISGCPSSCGTHQIAEIGFRGAVKQTPDGPKPAFAIFTGGCPLQGKEVLADTGKAIAADEIPRFLVELGRMIAAEHATYADWIRTNRDRLDALIASFTA